VNATTFIHRIGALRFGEIVRRLLALGLVMAVASLHAQSQDDLARGRDLFLDHCATCHGPNGEGGRGPTLAVPKLVHAQTDEQLLALIQYGVVGSVMPESILEEGEIQQVAAWVRKLGQSPVELPRGNAQRGAQLYQGKGGCVRCHAINGYGGAIGPDLSEIGSQRGAAYLRAALIDPEADVPKSVRSDTLIPANFLFVEVEVGARRFVGVRVNEDAFSIQIRDLAGDLRSLRKSDITELRKLWSRSPMPSYRSLLSADELDDLVAFLAARRSDR
jgi:cytochrome c oxidase cbb3-type subunit III